MNQHIWDPDVFYGIDADLDEFFESTPRVPTFACVVVPEADLEGDFEELCEIVYDQGHTLFVVEEAPRNLQARFYVPDVRQARSYRTASRYRFALDRPARR